MKPGTLAAIGVILIAIGVAFAALPKQWIEDTLGFEPDGGNGMLELLMALVPVVVGLAMVAAGVVRRSSEPARRARSDVRRRSS